MWLSREQAVRKVKWSIRDDGNSTWAKHYHGPYVVFVTDKDGDATDWEVYLKADLEKAQKERDQGKLDAVAYPQANGRVEHFDDFEIGQAVAIEALDAIIRARTAYDAELAAERKRDAERPAPQPSQPGESL